MNFMLGKESMDVLDSLHQDMRVLEVDRLQKSLHSDKPDGYKIFNNPNSSLPTKVWTG